MLPRRRAPLVGGTPCPIGERSNGDGTGEEDPPGTRRIDELPQGNG
jgi:hypothetical protein